jgi:CRP/FNR family transcriptional regulator, dissimilatory nitrate respiration regulator
VHDSEQRKQGNREDWLPQSVRDAGVSRVLGPGDFLFRIDTPTAGLYEVVKGRIKLVRIAPSGRETILYTAAAGDFVAEASSFSPTYHCDAIAATDSVVRLYPKRSLFAAFRENPQAAQAFMGMLAREVMSLRTRLEQRNIHTARDRVRHYLTLNAGADGRTVVLSGTLKELAGELGLSHEALYRTLADMAADAEIERLEGKIRLKSPDV